MPERVRDVVPGDRAGDSNGNARFAFLSALDLALSRSRTFGGALCDGSFFFHNIAVAERGFTGNGRGPKGLLARQRRGFGRRRDPGAVVGFWLRDSAGQ